MLGPAEQVFAVLQERVSGVFRKPFEIDGHTIRAVARYGIARYPDDGESAKSLLENAEAALKDAKAGGEDFVHYKMQAHRGQDQRLALEQRLRVAIEERQFLLHYQPKIDICSGRIVGLEALLRWDDPERGLVAPGEFLPVLEATHLIVEVGDRVIKQALTDLCHWAGLGIGDAGCGQRVTLAASAAGFRRSGADAPACLFRQGTLRPGRGDHGNGVAAGF